MAEANVGIRDIVLRWMQMDNKQMTCILGPVACGKTTILELCRQFINEQNRQLSMSDKGLYTKQKIINPKTIKPITLLPECHVIGKMNFLEIPALIYSPSDKKRPNIDRILNIAGLINAATMINFVFLVDQKNTKTKVDAWKKYFKSVLDMFKSDKLNENLLNSISFLVTKAPLEIDRKTCQARTEALAKTIIVDQIQPSLKQKYTKLVEDIKTKNRINVFAKTTKQRQIQIQKEIKQIYEFMTIQPKCQISQTDKRSFWADQKIVPTQQQIAYIEDYYVWYKLMLKFLSDELFNWLFQKRVYNDKQLKKGQKNYMQVEQLQSKTQTFQDYMNGKFSKKIQTLIKETDKEQNQLLQKNEVVNQRFQKLIKQSSQKPSLRNNFVGVVKLYFELIQLIESVNTSNGFTSKLLTLLANFKLLTIDKQSQSVWKRLIQFQHFQSLCLPLMTIDFTKITNQFKMEINKIDYEQILKNNFLQDAYRENQTPQFYEELLNMMEKFYPKEDISKMDSKDAEKLEIIKDKSLLSSLNMNEPKQCLKRVWKFYKQKKQRLQEESAIQMKYQIYKILGRLLAKLSHYEMSGEVFRKCNCFYLAKQSYRILIESESFSIQAAYRYLDILEQMNLKQKFIETCYLMGDVHFSQRNILNQKIKILKQQNKQCSLMEVKLTSKNFPTLEQHQEQSIQKLVSQLKQSDK